MVAVNPLSYCLRLLKTRLRSRAELVTALTRREVSPELQQTVLAELEALKLVDDSQFARAWIHTRDRLAPRGELILRQELFQKGIPKDIIESALIERRQVGEGQLSEEQLASELLEHRTRQFANLSPEVRKRRQIALLQRRGFSYTVIKRIMEA